jgi:spartin
MPIPPYDPSTFKPGEAYVPGSASSHAGGQIVLIDEENGSVVGELGDGFQVVEDSKMQAGSKGMHIPHSILSLTNIPRPRRNHPPL